MIIMVIDAMRYNFITSTNNLKFIKKSLQQKNKIDNKQNANDDNLINIKLFELNVDIPTVTMPRIKTLTTGSVSNFIDIVLNLGSTELKSDSIIYQIENNNGKIVFYGDNTWIKLFPKSFYRQMENTDSFFVQDFYEVCTLFSKLCMYYFFYFKIKIYIG